MKVLLAAATEFEIAPTLDYLKANWKLNKKGGYTNDTLEIYPCITGVGLTATTFSLTKALLRHKYDFALQAGIAGSYHRALTLGRVVLVRTEEFGDLGAEDHENFLDVFDLGFVDDSVKPFSEGRLVNPLKGIPFPYTLPMVSGLTVHTASGNAMTIARRAERWNCGVESMEGGAFHYVCLQMGIPFLQLRAISNYVTPRKRSEWMIPKAIRNLNLQLMKWLAPAAPPVAQAPANTPDNQEQ